MASFIEFLIKQFVNNPEDVSVEEIKEGTVVTLNVFASPDDMGLIIGKSGKTIRSIRALAKAKAIKDGVKVYLNVC